MLQSNTLNQRIADLWNEMNHAYNNTSLCCIFMIVYSWQDQNTSGKEGLIIRLTLLATNCSFSYFLVTYSPASARVQFEKNELQSFVVTYL
jgi:hypothetical protein